MDLPSGATPRTRTDRVTLVEGLDEGISTALDLAHERMFVTDFSGNLYTAGLDGSGRKVLHTGLGRLTGIAYTGR